MFGCFREDRVFAFELFFVGPRDGHAAPVGDEVAVERVRVESVQPGGAQSWFERCAEKGRPEDDPVRAVGRLPPDFLERVLRDVVRAGSGELAQAVCAVGPAGVEEGAFLEILGDWISIGEAAVEEQDVVVGSGSLFSVLACRQITQAGRRSSTKSAMASSQVSPKALEEVGEILRLELTISGKLLVGVGEREEAVVLMERRLVGGP